MSRLDDLINDHDPNWTADELADWLDTLPADIRTAVLQEAAAVRKNGRDVVKMLSRFRMRWESLPKQQGASLVEILSDLTTGWFIGGLKRGHMPENNGGNDNVYVARVFGN